MKSLLAVAVAVLPLFLATPKTLSAEPPEKTEPWIITVTRADATGKVLSRASVPCAYNSKHKALHGSVSVNMGTAKASRLWQIDFQGGLATKDRALIYFSVRDTTLLQSSMHEGTSNIQETHVLETNSTWRGPGRYWIATKDGETLTAEIRPLAQEKTELEEHSEAQIIEITRKNQAGKVINRASSWWEGGSSGIPEAELCLWGGAGSRAALQKIRCRIDEVRQAMAFRVWDVVRLGTGDLVTSIVVYDAWTPLNESGRYLVYALDGETVEVEIRSSK